MRAHPDSTPSDGLRLPVTRPVPRALPRTARRVLTALAAVAAVVLSVPGAATAQAQQELPRGEPGQYQRPPAAQEAIDQLKSPYCPGMMLEVCSSRAGAALRDSLSRFAEEGWTTEELVDWVLGNHGEEWLALPPARGRSLIAWVVPPLGLVVGIFLVVWALRAMRRKAPSVEPLDEELSEEEEARLRAAMKELDREEEATFF